MLPYPEAGKNDKETLNNLFDAYFKLRKELEWLLHNLDDNNILEIDAAKIKNLEAVLIVSDTVITNILYAQEGRIARLTVDHLLTEDLLVGAEIMDYIDIEDNYIKFIHATRLDELPQIQYTDTSEAPLYWDSEAHNHMTTEDTGIPVMVYQYERQEKMKIWFNPEDPNHVPIIELGIGSGYGDDYGKGFIYKGVDGLYIEYRHSVTGNPRIFKLTDDGLDLSQFENVDFNENVYLMHRGRNLVQESDYSNAEGDGSKATGPASHAEGVNTKASGSASHAEGRWTHAAESNSHAEGAYAQALSSDSHAGGSYTMAGPFEFVDGAVLQSAMLASPAPVLNYANPSFSVSDASVFSGMSHILMVTNGFYEKWEIGSIVGSRIYLEGDPFREGTFGTAVGAPIYPITDEIDADASFVHGYDNKVCGYAAACFGVKNIAHREAQFVVGKYNNPLENTLFVVGNGNGTTRSNALSVDDGGNLDISGEYRVNGVAIGNVDLGETENTAYRGDRGKAAYDHSQGTHAPTDAQKNSDITKEEIEAKLTGIITSHTHSGGGGISYAPLTNGNVESPELLFYDGDVILVEVL